tara:strand:- start:330 stop:539 length:210 start_codon:yes stop_codon:yes gene_type:complete
MTLTKVQQDIMVVTYAQAQIDLIKMIKKDKYTDLNLLMKVLKAWQKKQQVKVDKLDEDYEEPMELDTDD